MYLKILLNYNCLLKFLKINEKIFNKYKPIDERGDIMEINSDFLSLRIDFLRKLLYGQSVVPISQHEVVALNKIVELNYINQFHSRPLVGLILDLDGLVKPVDAVMFLIDVVENTDDDGLTVALETLEGAIEDNLVLSASNLVDVFKDCSDGSMAPSLILNIIGEEKEEKIVEPPVKRPALNLDAMRDFK